MLDTKINVIGTVVAVKKVTTEDGSVRVQFMAGNADGVSLIDVKVIKEILADFDLSKVKIGSTKLEVSVKTTSMKDSFAVFYRALSAPKILK